ncbi:MAG: PE-PGRS family protein [Ignavibacteria bacterium]|nr:PE-PGRS family protein [Ignavibacteria bacterium]
MNLFVNVLTLLILVSYTATSQNGSVAEMKIVNKVKVGNLDAPGLDEVSGCVASSINKDLLWVHNDSGDDAVVYALSTKGELRCAVSIENATNRDWEDISMGPGPEKGKSYLYVGDIGDNNGSASTITVYRIAEPTLDPLCKAMTLSADRIEMKYPDGPRDAEALIIDPVSNDMYIITKRERKSRVYKLSAPFNFKKINTLSFVTELPFSLATAADISHSGKSVIVKNYVYVYGWERSTNESLASLFKRKPSVLPYMPELQGEAVCFSATDDGYFTLSERPDTTVDYAINYYFKNNTNNPTYVEMGEDKFYMSVIPSADTKGIYNARYNIPIPATVRISVRNEIMMEVENVEPSTFEQGLLEREIDMIDKPEGTYVVVLCADRQYSTSVLEVKHR